MERIDFNGTDISGVLDRLPDEARNRLPFGVVKLDPQGTVLAYNMAEAEISGVKPADVIGKNFFLEVAVCTQRPEFYGRFRDAMDNDRVLNLIFDYEFQNALYSAVHDPIKVRVHMFSSYEIGGKKIVWLMVKRVGGNRQPRPSVQEVASAPTPMSMPQYAEATMFAPQPAQPVFSPAPNFPPAFAAPAIAPTAYPSMQPAPAVQPPMYGYGAMPAMAPPMMPQPGFTGGPMPAASAMPQMPNYAAIQPAAPATNRPEVLGADIIVIFDDV